MALRVALEDEDWPRVEIYKARRWTRPSREACGSAPRWLQPLGSGGPSFSGKGRVGRSVASRPLRGRMALIPGFQIRWRRLRWFATLRPFFPGHVQVWEGGYGSDGLGLPLFNWTSENWMTFSTVFQVSLGTIGSHGPAHHDGGGACQHW